MSSAVLSTKLFIPQTRTKSVSRPRLSEQLNRGLFTQQSFGRSLTLISASAGFGKTTLVSQWIAGCGNKGIPATWLSLDKQDNDFTRFMLYLISALQKISNNVGEGLFKAFQSHQELPYESALTSLVNEIADNQQKFILVLDDYHAIHLRQINDAVVFLLENLPPQMHMVIITREDPNIPLSRLRSRGQSMEIRAADLQFTLEESAVFLSDVMSLELSSDNISALKTHTEGWITGLQLAGLSMQGRKDIDEYIQSFKGSHRFILDYLVDEVLHNLRNDMRTFLLQTSILERLSSELCNAVTARNNSKEILDNLDRGNLFILQLDEFRQWYRYHHLFADVLKTHLLEEFPETVPTLHMTACYWYERNGFPADAVIHALAAGDFEHVATLAEREWQSMEESFQIAAWLDWVEKIPEEILEIRPVLTIQLASVLLDLGDPEASEKHLKMGERWTEMPLRDQQAAILQDKMIVVEDNQFQCLPGKIALLRAGIAQACSDASKILAYAEKAMTLLPESDFVGRAQAAIAVGFSHWINGNLDAAADALRSWINSMHEAGKEIIAIASTFPLASVLTARGHLREAVRIYEQSLLLASAQGEDARSILAYLYLGAAMLHYEMGNRESSDHYLKMAEESESGNTLPNWSHRWNLAKALVQESEENYPSALYFLDEAERLYIKDLIPMTRPVEALKTKIAIKEGRLDKALEWMHKSDLSVNDEFCFLKFFEYITLARVMVEQYKTDGDENTIVEAIGLLLRLKKTAEISQWNEDLLEILILLALAHQAKSEISRAVEFIESALILAAPEGYCRIFLREGRQLQELLQLVPPQSPLMHYIGRLSGFWNSHEVLSHSENLPEPLSKREVEVLRMLETELSGPEIAEKLFVSLNTLRTHTKSIYNKLGIGSRRGAVRRAKELDLI